MSRYLYFIVGAILIILLFVWGVKQSNKAAKENCEKETIVKEKEIIKYVDRKKSHIYAVSNISRNQLLKLMSENKL